MGLVARIISHLLEDEEEDFDDADWKDVTLLSPLQTLLQQAGYEHYGNGWRKKYALGHCEIVVRPIDDGIWRMTSSCLGKEMERLDGDELQIRNALVKIYDLAPEARLESEEDFDDTDLWKDVDDSGLPHWLESVGYKFDGHGWILDQGNQRYITVRPNYDITGKYMTTTWYGYTALETRSDDDEGTRERLTRMGMVAVKESEEDDLEFDVGPPAPIDDFLKRSGFLLVGETWEKLFNRGAMRLRIGPPSETGDREVSFIGGNIPLWTKHLSDEGVVELIDRTRNHVHEAEEEEDEGEDDWKDVTPDVPAAEIQRWVFTEYELAHGAKECRCKANDVFYAEITDCDEAVQVYRDGTVSNLWADGTVGVRDDIRDQADQVDALVKPIHLRRDDDDIYAETWKDVYVGEHGLFLAFVEQR